MAFVAVSHRHPPARLGLNTDAAIVCVLLLLGLAFAGLAAVAFPLGDTVTTGIYVVD
jgi:hypothetical protein